MSDQLQLRRDTLANIQAAVPAQGEPAYATDTGGLLLGDGATSGGAALALNQFFTGYVPGRYYFPGPSGAATVPVAANRLYASPFFSFQRQTFTKLGIEITTAAGTNGRLGIYKWANGVPSSLILDAGAINIASTGYQEITGLNFTLNPGVYGLAFLPDTAVTVRAITNTGISWFANFLLGASAPGAAIELLVNAAQTYGALPATFPASLTYQSANAPSVGLRL
jgi:hypothetical protein